MKPSPLDVFLCSRWTPSAITQKSHFVSQGSEMRLSGYVCAFSWFFCCCFFLSQIRGWVCLHESMHWIPFFTFTQYRFLKVFVYFSSSLNDNNSEAGMRPCLTISTSTFSCLARARHNRTHCPDSSDLLALLNGYEQLCCLLQPQVQNHYESVEIELF